MAIKDNKQVTNHGPRNPRFGRGGLSRPDHRASQAVIQRNPCEKQKQKQTSTVLKVDKTIKICAAMKISTWNVQSMYQPGKMHNIIQEMDRLQINILGVSEARWPHSGHLTSNNKTIYYSGNKDNQHIHGVAIILDKTSSKAVIGFVPISERVMIIQLKTTHAKLNLIQVYAPTTQATDEELNTFYQQIHEALKIVNNREITVLMGDFNAKIGSGKVGGVVGDHGLGERNERGDRLVEFCQEKKLIVTNTFFKLPKRRLYTWRAPSDRPNKIVRNQIDFILINERYKNAIQAVKTYPGADVASDHNPLAATLKLKLKILKKPKAIPKINTTKLQVPTIKEQVQNRIYENLNRMQTDHENINEEWEDIKRNIIKPCKEILTEDKKKKQEWMTEEILNMMNERRLYKGQNTQKYKQLQKDIRIKIRQAKEKYYEDRCKEIEDLDSKYDMFNLHKKVKELAGTQRKNQSSTLVDKKGKILMNTADKLQRWKEYTEELFMDNRTDPEEIVNDYEEIGPDITKEEVKHALKNMKDGKSPGPDLLTSDILKLIDDKHIDILVNIFNKIYRTGNIPKEWLVSTFICLPKKSQARECTDHRIISLMSHTLKVLLKVIHNRIYHKLDMDISNTQFGFRKGLGTREALFAFNVLTQRCLDVNKEVYACFIDYNKAFDTVRHDQLINILKSKHVDSRDIQIITNLYYNQKATVCIDNHISEEIEIQRGVRQGCVLSPTLFNAYAEEILTKVLENVEGGIVVGGTRVNNIRYADDTVILAESIEDLQRLMNRVSAYSEEYGLSLNIKKTKFMIISKNHPVNVNLTINGKNVERVEQYMYLGAMVNNTNEYTQEIRIRIEKARANFIKMSKVFRSRDLSMTLKHRLARCYVFSTLLYGAEAWTVNAAILKKIEAFEMWVYRRILRISWMDRVTNVEVQRRIGKEREVVDTIKRRKLEYLGHIIRGTKYEFLQLIVQGKIQGKRNIGRRRISWMRNLREWFGRTSNQLFKAAASKVKIAMMIANLRLGDGT